MYKNNILFLMIYFWKMYCSVYCHNQLDIFYNNQMIIIIWEVYKCM